MNQIIIILQLAFTLLVAAQNPNATILQKETARQTAIQAIGQANNEIIRLKSEQIKPTGTVYNTSNPYPVQPVKPYEPEKKLTIQVHGCYGTVTNCAIRVRYTEDGILKESPLKMSATYGWGEYTPMPTSERPQGIDGTFYWYRPQNREPRTLYAEVNGLIATTTCQGSN